MDQMQLIRMLGGLRGAPSPSALPPPNIAPAPSAGDPLAAATRGDLIRIATDPAYPADPEMRARAKEKLAEAIVPEAPPPQDMGADVATPQERMMAVRKQAQQNRLGDARPPQQNPDWPLPRTLSQAAPPSSPPSDVPPEDAPQQGPQQPFMQRYEGATSGGVPQQSMEERARFFANFGVYPFAGQGWTKARLAAPPNPSMPSLDQGMPPPNPTPLGDPDLKAMRGAARPVPMAPPDTAAAPQPPPATPPLPGTPPPRPSALPPMLRALAGRNAPLPTPKPDMAPPQAAGAMAPDPTQEEPGGGLVMNPPPFTAADVGAPPAGAPLPVAAEGSGIMDRLRKLMGGGGADALLAMGLGTMAAGSRPGATFLGSIGEGGLAAMKDQRERRKDDLADKREERALKTGEAQIGLSRDKLALDARQFAQQLQQRAEDASATREQRLELAKQADETRRLSIEMQRGNAEAGRQLQAMMIGQRGEIEAGRREDRAAEDRRRSDAEQRQIDDDAAKHFRDRIDALTQKGLVPETPEMKKQIENEVLDLYGPKTRLGRQAASRQLGDAISQIRASSLDEEEKQRRITEARKRFETLGK